MSNLSLVQQDVELDAPGRQAPDHGGLLVTLEAEIQMAQKVLLRAYDRATNDRSTPADLQQWVAVSGRWQALLDLYSREYDKLVAQQRDAQMAPEWQRATRKLERDLLAQYGDRGEQYRALCKVLAPLIIKLEKANDGGIRLKPAEHADLSRTVSGLVAQLQKHTESTRTETDVQSKVAMSVLHIVEGFIGNQPVLYQKVVRAVRHSIETREGREPRVLEGSAKAVS